MMFNAYEYAVAKSLGAKTSVKARGMSITLAGAPAAHKVAEYVRLADGNRIVRAVSKDKDKAEDGEVISATVTLALPGEAAGNVICGRDRAALPAPGKETGAKNRLPADNGAAVK
jgi:hypothetical protein